MIAVSHIWTLLAFGWIFSSLFGLLTVTPTYICDDPRPVPF